MDLYSCSGYQASVTLPISERYGRSGISMKPWYSLYAEINAMGQDTHDACLA